MAVRGGRGTSGGEAVGEEEGKEEPYKVTRCAKSSLRLMR